MAEQMNMSEDETRFWWDTIANRLKLAEKRHTEWRRLIDRYQLKNIEIADHDNSEVVKISRLYPMVREVVTGIARNYPEIFMEVDTDAPGIEEALETMGDDAMKRTKMQAHIQQGLMDIIFCFRAFWKIELASDSITGILTTRDVANFYRFSRVDPFMVLPDPHTLPHDFQSGGNFIEMMDIPLNVLIKNPRFAHKKDDLNKLAKDGADKTFEETFGKNIGDTDEPEGMAQANKLRGIVRCYEVHDRMKGHRKLFVKGLTEPIENIRHPFLEANAQVAKNPLTGDDMDIEYTTPEDARFIIEGGLPYHTEQFDKADEFYGTPLAAYEEQVEKLIMESLTRRVDLLQRNKRISFADDQVKDGDTNFETRLKQTGDAGIMFIKVPANKGLNDLIVPADWGPVPQDQIQLERDALGYESQLIKIQPQPGRTATESAINAGPAELNRAAMETAPVGAYRWGIAAMFDLAADPRYKNDEWMQSFTNLGDVTPQVALNTWKTIKRRIEIYAASMTPFAEELDAQKTMAFVDRYLNDPMVDRKSLVLMAAKASNLPDPDGILRAEANIDAFRAAQFEIVNYLFAGQPIPEAVRGEDHQTHLQAQNPEAVQSMPQFQNIMQGSPQIAQQMMQTLNAHLQSHQARIDEESQGTSGPSAVAKPDSEQGTGTENPVTSQVRSSAQDLANTVQTQTQDQGVV